ncbi:uncharacterized protein PV06_09639 [Exophiala oligosperma]|uniref:R3H domain-containing protein n=1 Tax=Exophiala oligosperma TaxID=215243 RepID=A0A0D2DSS0_9EURO|nr:uncharacterized protein PV06_09639 [Exophiala oligosperma]KIW38689.1 hypothetical protein PV06_09639 [Exophiala oligosperma]
MASSRVGPGPPKLSFAKVAAMRAPTVPMPNSHLTEDKKPRSTDIDNTQNSAPPNPLQPTTSPRESDGLPLSTIDTNTQSEYVTNAIQGLSLVQGAATAPPGSQSADSGESLEDDQSQLSNSSIKQQSFDTKSMASVTTFAMDEKESIRPDDSASVRAAEDDEASSAPSREMSFTRDNERLNQRPMPSGVTIAARRYHTLTLTNPPRFGDLPVIPMLRGGADEQNHSEGTGPQQIGVQERTASLPVAPDEKLLDALASPKDRLSLLQLEEKFLGLLANSESMFLDLPPQNGFARLLTHKLADYYSLAHHTNDDSTSIRVFKTASASRPTPLHVLAQSIPAGPSQPPSAMAVKIMRRAGLGPRQGSAGGSTPASSSAPSKATSEAGVETNSEEGVLSPAETPNKDKSKLTREEREAQYKAARERIFGDFQESVTSENTSTGDNSASMSRSSSSSGRRKTRKQKTPKDDSFEARSAYIPSYAPMHMQQMQQHYQPQYSDQVFPNAYQGAGNTYGTGMNYGTTPTQSYPQFEPPMPYNSMGYGPNNNQQYSTPDSWSSVQSTPGNGFMNYSSSPTSGYSQGMPPTMMGQMNNPYMQQSPQGMQQSSGWMNNQFQNSYYPSSGNPGSNMNGWQGYQPDPVTNNGASYAYRQGAGQNYNANASYNMQNPMQGYSRTLFNPQTRSFVPNTATGRTGGRGGRKKPSPPSSQTRGSNIARPFSSDVSGASSVSSRGFDKPAPSFASPMPKEDSLQQKYGAPAHLPKKPPPSQVPPSFDVETLASNGGPMTLNGANKAPAGASLT